MTCTNWLTIACWCSEMLVECCFTSLAEFVGNTRHLREALISIPAVKCKGFAATSNLRVALAVFSVGFQLVSIDSLLSCMIGVAVMHFEALPCDATKQYVFDCCTY